MSVVLRTVGIATSGKRFIAASTGAKVIVAEERDREAGLITLNSNESTADLRSNVELVVAMTVSCQGRLLAVCTSEKRLVVWESDMWRVKGERSVPKRVTSLQFTENEEYILTADRTGEVTRYCVSDLRSREGEELLGHLSMLLDMVLVSHDSHVITCDRDEKIRVSMYPNSYNIETYCLGHTDFVSCICVCEKWPHILLSSSGDGTVRSWDWRKGQLLETHQCSDGEEVAGVTQVVCSKNMESPLVVASLEQCTELVLLLLSSSGTLECLSTCLLLPVSPWSCVFDWSDRLWVCLDHHQDPVQCWTYVNSEFQRCSSPLQVSLNSWELFKDCTDDRDWSALRKHTFDNMTGYLVRKEQRLLQKASMKQLHSTDPEVSPEKKKAKLQTHL